MPNIIEDKKKILFDAVSKDYNIGTFDEFSKKLEDNSKRKAFYEGVGAEYNLGSYTDFEAKIGVKKKAESGSSLDISAGPYASGQKPKGFGDIVSEKISEVSPIEKAKAKEDDFVRKQSEKELSKKDTYAKAAIRGAKTLGTTVITGLKDLDTGLSILGKKVRDTFGIKDTDLDEELESKLDDNQVVSIVRDYQKKVDNQAQEIQKLREQTGGSGITENISKGNYAKALDYTGKTFVESLAPSLMFLTPLTATMSMGKTVGDEMQQAKSEGRIPTATDVTAGAIKGAAEYALTAFLGVGKVTKKAVSETLFRKEASDAITKMVKSSFGKKVATTIGEEGFEEGLTQVVNNGVDIVLKGDKTKGWFDGVSDNVIVGMFGGGTQGTIANLILDKAEKEQGIETTQQGGQEEIGIISDAVNELQQNNVLLTINDIPVSIQVTNEGIVATDLETGDSVLVNSDNVLVDGQYPLTDVINEHIGQSEQQQQQQQAPPIELPKKIFHATKASFEGLPSRQEQSKVSAFGAEPAGTFYSTNPDKAKQAIGDGGDARIIEADFNPKNPLVIENTDNEVYSNIKNESEQQAIQELNDEYIESGVDLTTLEEGELPEEVNKLTTEIFADKLKEQGYDAVINNDNGDIIVLDDTVVTEKKAESKTEVVDSKDEVEYENYYDNLELSDRGKELQKQIDSIDDIIENKDKPLSNIQKFRLKDISPILLKGDIYGLVNLALLNIKTPVLLRDSVLNNGTQVKGIGVNKKDTWINTSTDANKAMSMDDLIHKVTEFVAQHIGDVSQTDIEGNASVAQLISNADIPNMVYDIITGSKESAYETLKQFADQEIDINSLMEERSNLQKELDEDQIQYEMLVSQESDKIDLREIQKNFELLFEVGGASKKKNLTSDPKIMEIYNNFDNIIEQLGYKKTKDADC